MNFGRSLTKNLKLNSEPVLALEAVRASIAAVGENADRRDIRVVTHIAIPEHSVLHADSALLAQALRSVVANAIRLSPRGGEVIVRASIDDNGALVFSAGDAGPALPQDLVAEVNGSTRPQQAFMEQASSSAVSTRSPRS
jgi:signal transduction histidine kinase